MASIYRDVCFHLSCDLAVDLKVYIDHLDIKSLPASLHEQAEDLIVTVRLIDGGLPLFSGFKATNVPYRQDNFVLWNEWLTLPVKIRDLPKTAQLVFELWGVGMELLGGTTVRILDSRLRLKRGMQQLTVWPLLDETTAHGASDGGELVSESSVGAGRRAERPKLPLAAVPLVRSDRRFHLLKAVERYELADTPKTPWLDRLAFARLAKELSARQSSRGRPAARGSGPAPNQQRLPSADSVLARGARERSSAADGAAARLAAHGHSAADSAWHALGMGLDDAGYASGSHDAAATLAALQGGSASAGASASLAAGGSADDTANAPPTPLSLFIHLPAFDVPVIFEEWHYGAPGRAPAPAPVPPAVVRLPHPGLFAAEVAPLVTVPMPVPAGLFNGTAASQLALLGSAAAAAAAGLQVGPGQGGAGGLSPALLSALLAAGGVGGSGGGGAGGAGGAGAGSGSGAGGAGGAGAGGAGGAGGSGGVSALSSAAAAAALAGGPLIVPFWNEGDSLAVISDPEVGLPNPVEAKYSRLARNQLRNRVDANFKPNRAELAAIQAAVAAPTLDVRHSLGAAARELLWKFRHSLTGNRKALTKFLQCVDWEDEEDAREAVALLPRWAPIDTEDALRLLSHDFRARAVREHAVNALRRASDADLVLYLLQLVQALRYEPDLLAAAAADAAAGASGGPAGASGGAGAAGKGSASAGGGAAGGSAGHGPGGAAAGPHGGYGSASAGAGGGASGASGGAGAGAGGGAADGSGGSGALSPSAADVYAAPGGYALSPLADFLIERACGSVELGNFLHWYLTVELEDARLGGLFSRVHGAFLARLGSSDTGLAIADVIVQQGNFFQQLSAAATSVTAGRGTVQQKVERLNAVLAPGGAFGELSRIQDPVSAPLNPGVLVDGVVPKGCRIFKSALYPTVITLAVHPGSELDWTAPPPTAGLSIQPAAAEAARAARDAALRSGGDAATPAGVREAMQQAVAEVTLPAGIAAPASYRVIFKNGDDMRQDQLIIQMIRLMDAQLKRVGLDLRLTPYRVLATSSATGMMEMVLESEPVSAVLDAHRGDIMAFLRAHHPKEGAEYGIDPDVMDTYVKSCAGYAVVTYILGIGDRHLDNIMLRRSGHLFHIDFGFIFGRDPKPMPPPMRLTKEMIDGMGGPDSTNFARFRSLCCQAFNILRKSANLVISLLNLMRDAGIEALAEAPDLVIGKMLEKFRLDIDDEAADQVFLKLVDEAMAAIMPAVFEVLHKVRVMMR